MLSVTLPVVGTVAAWKAEVRLLAARGVLPKDVQWSVGTPREDLFSKAPLTGPTIPLHLTRAAAEDIETAMLHRDPERFALGHAAVIAVSRQQSRWGDRSDPVISRLMAMGKTVRRAIHKMHAFVRFRELPSAQPGRRRFGAWFEPEHPIAEAAAPFFANRFGDMDWAIATPEVTLIFDGNLRIEQTLAPPATARDATEDLWRTYFGAIFNPARLNPRMMQSEMPRHYWKNLPEADLIPDLIRTAPAAVAAKHARAKSEAPPSYRARAAVARARIALPAPGTLDGLAAAARQCTRCQLHGPATQTVWGEGPQDARLMIVGEAPGDHEDLKGRPFQGPAGQLLDSLFSEIGMARDRVYLTNAVKHFGFRPVGRKRLHVRPETDHIEHCRWWLSEERRVIKPRVVLGLGTTAMRAVTGKSGPLHESAGKVQTLADSTKFIASYHPAYILRLPDKERAAQARALLRQHLSIAVTLSHASSG